MKFQTLLACGIVIIAFAATLYFTQLSGFLDLKKITAAQTGALITQMMFYAVIVERVTEVFVNASFAGKRKDVHVQYIHQARSFMEAKKQLEEAQKSYAKASVISQLATAVQTKSDNLEKVKENEEIDKKLLKLKTEAKWFSSTVSITLGILLALIGIRVFGTLSVSGVPVDIDTTRFVDAVKGIDGLTITPEKIAEAINSVDKDTLEIVPAWNALSEIQKNLFRATDVIMTGLLLAGGASGLHPLLDMAKKINPSPVDI
ncbi:MAG: hypothetical protein ACPGVT_06120 [Maricaulaceae bacterium]